MKKIFCRVWTKEGCQDLTRDERDYFDRTQLHRLDEPAIEYTDGTKCWYVDGKRHRLDGPAVEYSDGLKIWYIDGKPNRLDGPAIELTNGTGAWWVDGKQLPTKEIETWIKENDVDLKTKEGQIAFKLRWS